jgi:hypothetical protein
MWKPRVACGVVLLSLVLLSSPTIRPAYGWGREEVVNTVVIVPIGGKTELLFSL